MRARAVPQDGEGRGAADIAAIHHGIQRPPHADPTERCAQVHPHVPLLRRIATDTGAATR